MKLYRNRCLRNTAGLLLLGASLSVAGYSVADTLEAPAVKPAVVNTSANFGVKNVMWGVFYGPSFYYTPSYTPSYYYGPSYYYWYGVRGWIPGHWEVSRLGHHWIAGHWGW
jgi:nitric oxide reductase large subunit